MYIMSLLFYIANNSHLETDLQNFISHNNFKMS